MSRSASRYACALAKSFGWNAELRDDKTQLGEAMQRTLETPGPALLDVRVTKHENCYPMIPAGQAARDMVG